LRRKAAHAVLGAALALQLIDTIPLSNWVHTELGRTHPSPLKSQVWSQIGAKHANLIVLPAWQCAGSPGGQRGFRTFGLLAASQALRTNSYFAGRYAEPNQREHCGRALAALVDRPLASDSAYVVSPELVPIIDAGPSGPGNCHDVDDFVLCSVSDDFGLRATSRGAGERLPNALANGGFEGDSIAPWVGYKDVSITPSAERARSGKPSR